MNSSNCLRFSNDSCQHSKIISVDLVLPTSKVLVGYTHNNWNVMRSRSERKKKQNKHPKIA